LKPNCYVISRENKNQKLKESYVGIEVISIIPANGELLVLFKKTPPPKPAKFVHIKDSDTKFAWVEQVKNVMKEADKLVLVSQNEPLSGIIGLVNCLRKEPGGEVIKCLNIVDPKAPKFDPDLPFYEVQLDKDLAVNVFKDVSIF
jgi:fatty acid synthase, animal type